MALPRSRAVASPPRRSQAATQSNRGQSLSPLPARLFVDEKTGLDRNNEILLGGLPLSQGLLRQGGWFNLKNAAGKRFAVEGTPAAWWPDGSIHHPEKHYFPVSAGYVSPVIPLIASVMAYSSSTEAVSNIFLRMGVAFL